MSYLLSVCMLLACMISNTLIHATQWNINTFVLPKKLGYLKKQEIIRLTDTYAIVHVKNFQEKYYLIKFNITEENPEPKIIQIEHGFRPLHDKGFSFNEDGSGYLYIQKSCKVISYKIDKNFVLLERKEFDFVNKNATCKLLPQGVLEIDWKKNDLHIFNLYSYQKNQLENIFNQQYILQCSNKGDTICLRTNARLWYKHKDDKPVEIELLNKYKNHDIIDITPDGQKALLAKENKKDGTYFDFCILHENKFKDLNIENKNLKKFARIANFYVRLSDKRLSPIFLAGNSIFKFDYITNSFSEICKTPDKLVKQADGFVGPIYYPESECLHWGIYLKLKASTEWINYIDEIKNEHNKLLKSLCQNTYSHQEDYKKLHLLKKAPDFTKENPSFAFIMGGQHLVIVERVTKD